MSDCLTEHDRVCPQCLVSFYVPPSRVSASNGVRFCSRECFYLWKKTNPKKPTPNCVCKVCFSGFHLPPSKIKEGRQYCSRKCSDSDKVTFEEKFFKNIVKQAESGCIIWIGETVDSFPHNYGTLCANKKHMLAHRCSYEMFVGSIPKGLLVLHRCDNPPCVNPAHLFLGTQKDNSADMIAKNRQLKGELNAQAKISESQVREIRRRWENGNELGRDIAKDFGVSVENISAIVTRKTWKHLS